MKPFCTTGWGALAVALLFADGSANAAFAQENAPQSDSIHRAVTGESASKARDSQPADPANVNSDSMNDIVVTARKRDETLISVPVVVTAVSGPQLAARGIINLDGLARITPQLISGNQGGAVQGGNITIRGISGPDQNPFGDQAVSFNVDGVQVAKATVRRMSDFDIAQIEVLKGPQALFFGKNSPAGIISIHTADPTGELEAKISSGYEIYARQIRTEAYVSGPVSDNLGFRLAGLYENSRGDLKDLTPADSVYAPSNRRNPTYDNWALRGTLKWEPSDSFDVKAKATYGQLRGDGPASSTAFISCPLGQRFTGSGIDQCRASDGANSNAGYGPILATIGGTLNRFRSDGSNFQKQDQLLASMEMNYLLGSDVTVTSVTGYYDVSLDQCQNYENDPAIILPSCGELSSKEFSQELRLSTDYLGPLNFTAGVFYANTKASTSSLTLLYGGNFPLLNDLIPGYGSPENPAIVNNYRMTQHGQAYSAFLQLSYKPIDVIEINVGGRYSYEKKNLPTVQTGGGLSDGDVPGSFDLGPQSEIDSVTLPKRKDSWNDFSPEVTISYRPSNALTLFASYKHGFLSGGFNAGSLSFARPAACSATTPDACLDLSYKPQTIKGFEGGVKADLFDRTLRANFAAYSYKVTDLQVSNVINATNTISNAGGVEIYGFEADANWRTPVHGLSLNASTAYNHGKYSTYPNAPCYGGQTLALGCVNGSQDLGGTELIRAPRWNLAGGFDYQQALSDALKFNLSFNAVRTTSYLTDSSSAPNGRQPAYTLLDATARIATVDDRYEFSIVGRNLTDKHYIVASSLVPFAQNPTGGLLDRFGSLSRGREIWLRVAVKFSSL